MGTKTKEGSLSLTTSRLFASWLASRNASIAFTTYQAGKFFLIGVNAEGSISVFERTMERPMALCARGGDLYLSTLFQVWRFAAIAGAGDYQGYDRLYSPRQSWVTGDIDIHDIKIDAEGRTIFVNTLFSCLATLSTTDSFNPFWRPKFISKLAAEDRCHLNGMAIRDGCPAFVTAVGRSDIADGWRDHRRGGGVVIDVSSNEIVASGLSMPHAPRWRDGRIFIANAGTGEFGEVDLASGKFTPITFCPGFLRGLDFIDDFAVVTMSLPRGDRTFEDLPLQETLDKTGASPRCGLAVIDLKTGDLAHWLRLEGAVTELFDAVILNNVKRPAAIGFRSDEIRRVLSVGPAA
ncbi:MAG: TIGR03032 family protein [Pseudomonadota bacterium]